MRVIGSAVAATAVFAVACTRDPLDECADIGPGDVVVTEIRGPQAEGDTGGVWIELFNTTSGSLELRGLKVRFRKVDGSGEIPIIVRRSLTVAAGGYVVLGLFDDGLFRPDHVDYGFAGDFSQSFLAAAAIDVESCGTQIDRARYANLPKDGTYSFGGTPSADNNDVLTMWCINTTSSGTPQQANPPCPP